MKAVTDSNCVPVKGRNGLENTYKKCKYASSNDCSAGKPSVHMSGVYCCSGHGTALLRSFTALSDKEKSGIRNLKGVTGVTKLIEKRKDKCGLFTHIVEGATLVNFKEVRTAVIAFKDPKDALPIAAVEVKAEKKGRSQLKRKSPKQEKESKKDNKKAKKSKNNDDEEDEE